MDGDVLPENWRWTTLGEVVHPSSRAIVSGPFGSNIGSQFFVEEGVPVIRGNNLTTDALRFIDDGFVFVTDEKADELRNCDAVIDDLVFTAAGSLGQVGLIPKAAKYPRYIISNKQLRARLDKSKVDPLFAFYWFASKRMVAYVQQRNTGSSVPLINLGVLRSLPLPLPPLAEQRAIAHILGTLDDTIELNRRMNETLEAMARALFKSWFVDFDPVRAKAEGRDCGLPKPLADLFPARLGDSELGEIPEGWEVKPFGDLLTDSIGGDWGKEMPDESHAEPIAIIRGTDIPDIDSGSVGKAPVRYTTRGKLERRSLHDGDIVIEVSGGSPTQPTGRSLFVSQHILDRFSTNVVCASFCRRFRSVSRAAGVLASQHLTWLYRRGGTWEYQNQNTGIANFQTTRFLDSELIIWPDESVLSEYVRIVEPMIRTRGLNESLTLAALRDALLPKLISGELRIEDAERFVGRVD